MIGANLANNKHRSKKIRHQDGDIHAFFKIIYNIINQQYTRNIPNKIGDRDKK